MTEEKIKVILVAGARPNFMKVAPLVKAIGRWNESGNLRGGRRGINPVLVHTGQHYDAGMSGAFFDELGIPSPDVNLEVGSGSHAVQTAEVMVRFEKVCIAEKPDWVVVVGDVNSSVACALVATKLGIRVAHVEAGLRSFDRTMPEEINRLVTDQISDLLFTPSEDGDENLIREGVAREKICRVGNVMIDSLVAHLDRAREGRPYARFGLEEKGYMFVTLHRPSNVDGRESLERILDSLLTHSKVVPVLFPVHPRTRKNLERFGLLERAVSGGSVILTSPLGYHDTIGLIDRAKLVLTDSGGIQEETTFLGIPCLTLRPNTERPVTVKLGTNKLTTVEALADDVRNILDGNLRESRIPDLWDGHTAERIINCIANCKMQIEN